jgi:hypothetical protein
MGQVILRVCAVFLAVGAVWCAVDKSTPGWVSSGAPMLALMFAGYAYYGRKGLAKLNRKELPDSKESGDIFNQNQDTDLR